jgi:hypothetical protein
VSKKLDIKNEILTKKPAERESGEHKGAAFF